MLNYETTSFHNNATLRIYGLRPAPEFEAWLERMGLWRGGRLSERAGDASLFIGRQDVRGVVFGAGSPRTNSPPHPGRAPARSTSAMSPEVPR